MAIFPPHSPWNLERFKTLAGSIALFPFIGTRDASGENTLRYTDWSVWREHVELSTVKVRSGRAATGECTRGCASNGLRNGPTVDTRSHDSFYHFCRTALFRPERDTWDSSLSKLGVNRFRFPGFQQQVKNRYIRMLSNFQELRYAGKDFSFFFFRVEKRVAREKFFIRAKCDTLIPISFQLCWTEER